MEDEACEARVRGAPALPARQGLVSEPGSPGGDGDALLGREDGFRHIQVSAVEEVIDFAFGEGDLLRVGNGHGDTSGL